MRKTILIVAIMMLAAGARAQTVTPPPQLPDFPNIQIEAQKATDKITMLVGAGGNITVLAGPDGILLVDCEYPQMAEKIVAALKKISDTPVKYVVNTHWHSDHASGDPYFADHGATIVAHENVRRILASGTMRDGAKYSPAPADALPTITYSDHASLFMDGEEIRLTHVPNAHSDGDTIVYFANAHLIDTGDNYRTDGFPLVDQDNGGTVKGMIAALDGLIATYPADTKVIPGHGTAVMTVADIKPFVEMLRDCRARVEKAIKAGKTVDQMKQEKILAGYESYSHRVTSERFIEVLSRELTEEAAKKKS